MIAERGVTNGLVILEVSNEAHDRLFMYLSKDAVLNLRRNSSTYEQKLRDMGYPYGTFDSKGSVPTVTFLVEKEDFKLSWQMLELNSHAMPDIPDEMLTSIPTILSSLNTVCKYFGFKITLELVHEKFCRNLQAAFDAH